MGCAAVIAASRPLWFDEIFTWQIATRPNVRALIEALGPMDPSPPLHYLLVRGAHALFGTGQLATRLPALLAFLVTLVVLHRLVVPLAGPLFALVVVAALPLTPALHYAAEARPYTFLLACSATSLLAWREVTSGGRRRLGIAGLLVSLTAALYAHFYAFLLFVPIVAGEAVRTWTRRRLDLAVWVVLAVAGGLALPLLPLVHACLAVRTTFWAAPTLARLGLSFGPVAPLALVAVIATLLGLIARYLSNGSEAAPEQPPPAAPAHEVAAAAGLASLPLVGFLVARLVTNAYDGRYVLPSLLGVLLLLAHGSRLLRHRRTEVSDGPSRGRLSACQRAFGRARAPGLDRATPHGPTAAAGPRTQVRGGRGRVRVRADRAPSTRNQGSARLPDRRSLAPDAGSSPEISVLGLSALLPLHVEDYQAFVATHDRFWVFDETGRWGAHLRAQGTNSGYALAAEPGGLQLWTR